MNVDSAHQSNWEIAEVIFGVPLLLGIAMHFFIPFSLPDGIFREALLLVGMLLIFIGVRLVFLARHEFARFNQPTDPGQPTGKVIKTGVFAMSRNPLYLACVLIFLGTSLELNMLWTLAALLLSVILCHYILILPEERYLAAKFGQEYKEYSASVHRWFGHT